MLFLGANTPWVYALAEALAASGHRVTAVATYDSTNFRRLRPSWPHRQQPPANLHREVWVYPPGYVGTLRSLFAPFLRSRLAAALSRLEAAQSNGSPAWVIAPYPWFSKALRGVRSDRLIYYNLDDYVLYQPARSASTLNQESELIGRAARTLCLSRRQVETLRERFPRCAERILHFPLGVVDSLLNQSPELLPDRPIVGYIGNLIDRVDWRLVREVANGLPEVQFQFIGSVEDSGGRTAPNWERERAAALALPNVRHIGPVAQEDVGRHYRSFAVNWMPYDTGHAFNNASCPTKIMDGLASGRPLLSTDVPECRLYPEWIFVAHSAEDAITQIRRQLEAGNCAAAKDLSRRQVEFVLAGHTWAKRAELLGIWLSAAA